MTRKPQRFSQRPPFLTTQIPSRVPGMVMAPKIRDCQQSPARVSSAPKMLERISAMGAFVP